MSNKVMSEMFSNKPPKIRLIGLDLDKTALNSDKEITPRVHNAIVNAIEAGIQVLPATGRAKRGVPKAFLDIPGVQYALTANGANVYNVITGESFLSDCFTREDALKLLDLCEMHNILACIFLDGEVYSNPVDLEWVAKNHGEKQAKYMKDSRDFVPDVRKLIIESENLVEKYSLVFFDLQKREQAKEIFRNSGLCSVTWSLPDNLELNTLTANKGNALLELGKALGVPKEEIMAVGDSTNDLEMLKAVGYAVGMANSHPDVLEVVDDVTTTSDEDGVALVIEAVMPKK